VSTEVTIPLFIEKVTSTDGGYGRRSTSDDALKTIGATLVVI
jgi:hypothetical protein